MPRSACRRLIALAAVLAAAGCGRGSGPVPLRGVVKLDGQPVANAAVVFVAQTPGGRDAYGSTDANGAFRLTTTKPDDGALPGKYKVVIQPAGPGGGQQGKNGFGRFGYGGPCPPPGNAHHYHFHVYALDSALTLQAGASAEELKTAMEGHVVAEGDLVGTFQR